MSKEFMGNACAHIKGPNMDKAKYVKIGNWFKDTETGNVSIILDSLPLPHQPWTGWVNLFENDNGFSQQQPARRTTRRSPVDLEDDIPF